MAWSPGSSSQSPPGLNAIQPYRMHVSQKYLDLTRQKLELTRLPRDPRNAQRGYDPGLLKSDLEPLIDHWMENYDWRAQEAFYNDTLPQFRVPINGTRVHFVHKRASPIMAIPLLFIHGWPESFIAISKMIDALCDPVTTPPRGDDGVNAFHVVAPSIPGFGFSDPVPEAANNIHATAEIFDALMKGLGYQQYLIHASGWGFKIARVIAITHPESCIAIHTVNPEVPAPRSAFGYTTDELAGISSPMSNLAMQTPGLSPPLTPGAAATTLDRPQTTAYALCDSPSGLLAYILDAIRPPIPASPGQSPGGLLVPSNAPSPMSPQSFAQSPQSSRSPHSPSISTPGTLNVDALSPWNANAIINWVMLYWLPGPEVALRWLTNSSPLLPTLWASHSLVPLGITHFRAPSTNPGDMATLPQWAEAYHRIAMLRRRDGRVRFAAWERPGELVLDLREFANLLNAQVAMV